VAPRATSLATGGSVAARPAGGRLDVAGGLDPAMRIGQRSAQARRDAADLLDDRAGGLFACPEGDLGHLFGTRPRPRLGPPRFVASTRIAANA
jgi:hypothetical protein